MFRCAAVWDGVSKATEIAKQFQAIWTGKVETGMGGCAVKPIRTRLYKAREHVPHAEQRPRYSVNAAVRLTLKFWLE
jgi:hypothetical protein